jgi:hypothetical protein
VGLHIVDVINEWKMLQLLKMKAARRRYKIEEGVRKMPETVLSESRSSAAKLQPKEAAGFLPRRSRQGPFDQEVPSAGWRKIR